MGESANLAYSYVKSLLQKELRDAKKGGVVKKKTKRRLQKKHRLKLVLRVLMRPKSL
jgi:hypothetical protein